MASFKDRLIKGGLVATAITGSGASLQNAAEQLWLADWVTKTGSVLSGASGTYTATSSGNGLAVFGNDNGVLKPRSGFSLDAFVGTDDPITTTQAANASTASGGIAEVLVPATQAPVTVPLSAPAGVDITSATVDISDALLSQVWSQTLPASGSYGANTWGALLRAAGTSFTESPAGAANVRIQLQVRSSTSGTTYTFQDFLAAIYTGGGTNPWRGTVGAVAWPVTGTALTVTTRNGSVDNSGGSQLARAVAGTPGSIGYANLADVAPAGNGGFTETPTASTFTNPATGSPSASHEIAYARIQNNFGSSPTYASPLNAGKANLSTAAGAWTNLPATPITTGSTDDWVATRSNNPTVGLGGTRSTQRYPIAAATYIAAWDDYQSGNLNSQWASSTNVEDTVVNYLKYVSDQSPFAAGGGQALIAAGSGNAAYYAALPSDVITRQQQAVALVG